MSEEQIYIEGTTVRTFTNLELWKTAAEERGLRTTTDQSGEHFVEDDTTMVGYFNEQDRWGMLV